MTILHKALAFCYESSLVRYGTVGACFAVLGLGMVTLLVELLHFPPAFASLVMMITAIAASYFVQRSLVFRSDAHHYRAGPKFVIISLSSLCLNALFFSVMLKIAPYIIAQSITLMLIFPLNYYMNRVITFESKASF